jgi:Flp pilus assembly pilin Flp
MADSFHALRRRGRSDTGQTMAEYSVVLSVITIACIGAIALLGGNIIAAIGRVAGLIP